MCARWRSPLSFIPLMADSRVGLDGGSPRPVAEASGTSGLTPRDHLATPRYPSGRGIRGRSEPSIPLSLFRARPPCTYRAPEIFPGAGSRGLRGVDWPHDHAAAPVL